MNDTRFNDVNFSNSGYKYKGCSTVNVNFIASDNYKKVQDAPTYIGSSSEVVAPLNENYMIFKDTGIFLDACKCSCVNEGDIFFELKEDGTFGQIAEVEFVNYARNMIGIKLETENGLEYRTYKLNEFLSKSHLNGFMNVNKDDNTPSFGEKVEITKKFLKNLGKNVGIPILGSIYSFWALGGRWQGNKTKILNGKEFKEYIPVIGQFAIKSAVDISNGAIASDVDITSTLWEYMRYDMGINLTVRSTAIWSTALVLQSNNFDIKLFKNLPDSWKDYKNLLAGEESSEVLVSRGANAGLTFFLTASIDFSNSYLTAIDDSRNLGEARYYKQYAKAKFINDLDENLCDIIGATILDFFCPGLGSWIGGPILSGIYETSYEVTEYLLEINGKPVPPRPMSGYENFLKKRTAISVLHTSAIDIYNEKCQIYPTGSIEYKSAKVQYYVDDIGYGSWQAVWFLAKSSCSDSEINDIKYSDSGQSNSFGFPEEGLSSYGFVEWVIHNAGYKISLDSLQENGMGVYIGGNAEFGVQFKHDKINVGDILYCSTEDEPYLISSESRTAVVTRIKHATVDSPGEIEIIEQTENGPETKVYVLDTFDEITKDFDRYIGMKDYYEDIDKNVDYSREDIQATISMIEEMENNEG